jgi:DNA-binding XRE family transcriptional regulator
MLRLVNGCCQDEVFMNLTSDMIDKNQLPDEEKSPLRLLRERAQLTQYQLRQRIGVSERRLSDWENGKARPSLENAVVLARTYQVSLKTICRYCRIDVVGVPDDQSLTQN